MSDVTVFVNGRAVSAPGGSRALDAVRLADAATADLIGTGSRALTDSRGLPVDASETIYPGAIYRVVSARTAAREESPDA